ncbi:MAG: hypothetical protein IH840_06485 [Candidatus Heimdallarchaeota archaeon]|nr:hypothetical protein [Candidatus Heimdallarchaeota archaeon]
MGVHSIGSIMISGHPSNSEATIDPSQTSNEVLEFNNINEENYDNLSLNDTTIRISNSSNLRFTGIQIFNLARVPVVAVVIVDSENITFSHLSFSSSNTNPSSEVIMFLITNSIHIQIENTKISDMQVDGKVKLFQISSSADLRISNITVDNIGIFNSFTALKVTSSFGVSFDNLSIVDTNTTDLMLFDINTAEDLIIAHSDVKIYEDKSDSVKILSVSGTSNLQFLTNKITVNGSNSQPIGLDIFNSDNVSVIGNQQFFLSTTPQSVFHYQIRNNLNGQFVNNEFNHSLSSGFNNTSVDNYNVEFRDNLINGVPDSYHFDLTYTLRETIAGITTGESINDLHTYAIDLSRLDVLLFDIHITGINGSLEVSNIQFLNGLTTTTTTFFTTWNDSSNFLVPILFQNSKSQEYNYSISVLDDFGNQFSVLVFVNATVVVASPTIETTTGILEIGGEDNKFRLEAQQSLLNWFAVLITSVLSLIFSLQAVQSFRGRYSAKGKMLIKQVKADLNKLRSRLIDQLQNMFSS